jgi:creatinine amidohydrolase/Fe(II)-dependent formamide hydrolase-like protein
MNLLNFLRLAAACCALAAPLAHAAETDALFMENLTWPELRDKLAAGATTVLVPIGGTEQNGPHMTLGKHNVRVRHLAGEIAQRLGNAVVAPVLAYVPEGSITPPAAHMRFTGTLSIPEATFEAVLEATAQSLRQHGFRDIFFLGDHGGYQKNEVRAAAALNRQWAHDSQARAYALTAYYDAAQKPFSAELRKKGFSDAQIGTHAALADTSLMLALDPAQVRSRLLGADARVSVADGVYGDPRAASAVLGRIGVQLVVDQSVSAIHEALAQRPVH